MSWSADGAKVPPLCFYQYTPVMTRTQAMASGQHLGCPDSLLLPLLLLLLLLLLLQVTRVTPRPPSLSCLTPSRTPGLWTTTWTCPWTCPR
jgi:hypothetical protein